MAIDVLNLIALVQSQNGGAGPLKTASVDRIGLWGHSMGGGIATRVLTVTDHVKAAVLYAPMSGDEQKNYEAIRQWSGQTRGLEELSVPAEALDRISPTYFFRNITAAISIHHGTADTLIPTNWSATTCDQLTSLGKNVECIYYDNMPHTFTGSGDEKFMENTVQFFSKYLRTP
jgi:dipeptidyl aminopeptidase/acylaminoacyl peptidase